MTDLNTINGHTPMPELRLVEAPTATAIAELPPLAQQTHDLMMQSIDKVAGDWIGQLQHNRANSEAVEAMVLQRIAKVKNEINQLYLLGGSVMAEANRGDLVIRELADRLDQLAEEQQS